MINQLLVAVLKDYLKSLDSDHHVTDVISMNYYVDCVALQVPTHAHARVSHSVSVARTHARTHTHTHSRLTLCLCGTHARTHTHAHSASVISAVVLCV